MSTPAVRRRSVPIGAAIAVPILTGILLALHPPDPVDPFDLRDTVGMWLTVHIGLLIALPLLAWAIFVSLDGIDGPVARIARAGAVAMAAWYAAFDALMGIATGILVRETAALDAAAETGATELVRAWWAVPAPIPVISVLAIASWLVAVGGAAYAHHRAGSPVLTVAGFAIAALVFAFGGHPGLTGTVAMLAFAVALLPLARGTSRVPVTAA